MTSEYEKEEDNKIKDSKSDSFSSVLMSSMFAILMISLLLAWEYKKKILFKYYYILSILYINL